MNRYVWVPVSLADVLDSFCQVLGHKSQDVVGKEWGKDQNCDGEKTARTFDFSVFGFELQRFALPGVD